MEFNLEEAYKLYVNLDNITKAAQQHCADLGISYSEKYRHRLSRAINSGSFQEKDESYGEDVYDKESEKSNVESSFNMPSAWDAENNKFLSLEEYCKSTTYPSRMLNMVNLFRITNRICVITFFLKKRFSLKRTASQKNF